MVESMSKFSFLVYHKEYDSFLTKLRELGLVHVVHKQTGTLEDGSDLQNKLQLSSRYERIIKDMTSILKEDMEFCKPAQENCDASGKLKAYENFLDEKGKIQQRRAVVQKEIERMSVWGEFNWENVYALKDAGYIVRFFTTPLRTFDEKWIEEFNAIVINQVGSQVYFITITPSGDVVDMENCERVRLPEESLSLLKSALSQEDENAFVNEKETKDLCIDWFLSLKEAYRLHLEDIDYTKVILNSEGTAENKLFLLEGWIPTANEKEAFEFLDSNGYYYVSEKVQRDEPAPIKLKNNKFARLFHPITELYELPNYGETDLTPFFAPFYVMFFGLCLGDSGYGLLLTIIGLIGYYKVKGPMKSYMALLSILGAGTIVFGFISGTFFGIELLKVDWPWIQKLKAIMLDPNQLFNLSLIVGAIQIIFGMFIKAVSQTRRFGFFNALSAWGWFITIVGCGGTFAAEKFLHLDPAVAIILYCVCGGLGSIGIFLFNKMKRNVFINVGAGLWDSYNMATGLLGDILSYVRLFALGISGAVLGLVFDDLAMQMKGSIPVIGFIIPLIVLLFGHSMNIFMAGLGAFVHPMRLTFVEFYKNAGFEGGGKKYTPFAQRKKEEDEIL